MYFINANGNTRPIASTDGLAEKILYCNSLYFVRTENGTAWVGSDTEGFTRWKESPASGNFLAANQDNLWIAAKKLDRKSTRLNSSHVANSYAVFCLKKKKKIKDLMMQKEIIL